MLELGGSYEDTSEKPAGREEEFRAEVREDIANVWSKDNNPVTQFLLGTGVLEDMEVLRRCIMQSRSNKEVYLYNNKLSGLKTYISLVKDSYSVREKQAKIASSERENDNDSGEVEIIMTR